LGARRQASPTLVEGCWSSVTFRDAVTCTGRMLACRRSHVNRGAAGRLDDG
jgi:hypothetical protein